MSNYAKLSSAILDSLLWGEPPATRVVWLALLVMADENGEVDAALSGLARRANVSLPECDRALAFLEGGEEPWIEVTDRGWRLVERQVVRERTPMSPTGIELVYFIQARDWPIAEIKIGRSRDPVARLSQLQTGYPRELEIIFTTKGGAAEEQALHQRFTHLRLHGEWFGPPEEILAHIEELRREAEAPA